MELFKGYILTKDKQAQGSWSNDDSLKTLDEVRKRAEYAGVLADNVVLVDADKPEVAETLMDIVEGEQLDCLVNQTTRGRHFFFRNDGAVDKSASHVQCALGLECDYKVPKSYAVLKQDGKTRFTEWEPETAGEFDVIPPYFWRVAQAPDFSDMKAGDGRNSALFAYILTLQREGMTTEQCRETIRVINKYVLEDPLSEDELDVVLRDDAFKQPAFFVKGKFLHDLFAQWLIAEEKIKKINGALHVYSDGVYLSGNRRIEAKMLEHIPNLKDTQRKEVLKYLDVSLSNTTQLANARYIAFQNGILDIVTGEMQDFSPDMVITNRIPWDYEPEAYHELTDRTLDKLACDDSAVRSVLEECVGYCLYRRNELGKAFILTGDKSNGKSTFLDMIKAMLGNENVSSLDVQELGDRFSSSMMFGKLANIGDDISDEFMRGREVSFFKKIVTGNRIKAEMKGQDPFDFEPYVKLLFSANDIPRMKDKTGAVIRRLVIVPFNATFSKSDPDYDPWIKYKLCEPEALQYLIRLGVEGLKRVLENREFTQSKTVEMELAEYEKENNPLLSFIDAMGVGAITNNETTDVYKRYSLFCAENGYQAASMAVFSKGIKKRLGLDVIRRKVKGEEKRFYTPKKD